MLKLMDAGFAAPADGSGSMLLSALRGAPRSLVPYVLANGTCAVAPSAGTEMMARGELPGWGLVFGSFVSKNEASTRIKENRSALEDVVRAGKPAILARTSIATHRYSALLVGLEQDDAGSACRPLQAMGIYCLARSEEHTSELQSQMR